MTEYEGPLHVAPIPLPKKIKGERRPPLTFEQRRNATDLLLEAMSKAESNFACAAKQWCVTTIRKVANIAIVQDPIFTGLACDIADIVIVPVPLKYKTCLSGALLITRDTLRKRGSLEITLPKTLDNIRTPEDFLDQMDIIGALDGVTREWTKHRYYQWRSDQFDPPFDDRVNYSDE